MLAVARDGDLSPLRAWSHGLGEGWVGLVSCRWCPSWLRGGEGLNHQAHQGHEQRGRWAWVRKGCQDDISEKLKRPTIAS